MQIEKLGFDVEARGQLADVDAHGLLDIGTRPIRSSLEPPQPFEKKCYGAHGLESLNGSEQGWEHIFRGEAA
jgi:hypothetical protein